ncbi:MAG: hypothetical protein HKN92_05795 [Chitinophagales bacterium]|nr:hypothetical protein [Chitinophagales bacterium]
MRIFFVTLISLLTFVNVFAGANDKPMFSDDEHMPFDQRGPKKGYYGAADIGFVVDPGIVESNLAINIVNGYRFDEHFAIGIGSGLRSYIEVVVATVPIFIEPKYDFINNTISPFVAMGIGYSFEIIDGFDGAGFFFSPEVGASYTMNQQVTFTFGLGYEYQNLNGAGFDGISLMIGIGL